MEALDGIIRPEDVVVLIATGTHRASTTDERRAMLGDDVLAQWRVEDHDARDVAGQVDLGSVGDVPVLLDREWVAADLRITTGFVEPHFFAGFSGGPKMVAPGWPAWRPPSSSTTRGGSAIHEPPGASSRAIRSTMRSGRSRRPLASTSPWTSCSTTSSGSPGRSAARSWPCTRPPAHRRGARRCSRSTRPFDIVVTTNSGYPLDQNLYQAVKGMSAAAEIVRPGGTIICAAECRDGLPAMARTGRSCGRGRRPRTSWPPSPPRRSRAGPVAGPDPGQGPDQSPGAAADRWPRRRGGPSGPPRANRRHQRGRRSPARRRTRRPDLRPAAGPQTIAYLA